MKKITIEQFVEMCFHRFMGWRELGIQDVVSYARQLGATHLTLDEIEIITQRLTN